MSFSVIFMMQLYGKLIQWMEIMGFACSSKPKFKGCFDKIRGMLSLGTVSCVDVKGKWNIFLFFFVSHGKYLRYIEFEHVMPPQRFRMC